MTGIHFDWSKNWNDEQGEWIMDIHCPNRQHHDRFGYDWETQYESTTDRQGNPCEPYEGCPCCEDDSGRIDVMWNTIWPLDYDGMVTEERQVKILRETSCALVQNNDTDEWFVCLCSAGMDFSPHIAYAFMIAQKWLPTWLLEELSMDWCRQELGNKKFKALRNIIGQQIIMQQGRYDGMRQKWSNNHYKKNYTSYNKTDYYDKHDADARICDGLNSLEFVPIIAN